jgi:sugar lactone lactonase YvrE
MHEGHIVVADTYNDKLRSVDPVTRECRALPGEAGSGDMLSAPAGVASSGDVLFVADTDAHRIVTVDVPSGAVVEIEID